MTRVLITRPKIDADALAAALAPHGIDSVISPVLDIRLLERPPLQVGGVQAIMVTSLNGARALGELMERRDIPVYGVGPATGSCLISEGFQSVDAAGSDVKSLAQLILDKLDPADGPLVHAGGAVLAGDLKRMLEEKGFRVRREVLYSADKSETLTEDAIKGLERKAVTHAVFYSPRSMESFIGLAEKAGLVDALANVTAVVLSDAVARVVPRPMPWKEVLISPTIQQDSLIAVLTGAEPGKVYVPDDTKPLQTAQHAGIVAAEAAPPPAEIDAIGAASEANAPKKVQRFGSVPQARADQIKVDQAKADEKAKVEKAKPQKTGAPVKQPNSLKPEPLVEKQNKDRKAQPDPIVPQSSPTRAEVPQMVVKRRGFPLVIGLPLALMAGGVGALMMPLVTPTVAPFLPPEVADLVIPADDPVPTDVVDVAPEPDPALIALEARLAAVEQDLAAQVQEARELEDTLVAITDMISVPPVIAPADPALSTSTPTEPIEDVIGDTPVPTIDVTAPALDLTTILQRIAALEASATPEAVGDSGLDAAILQEELAAIEAEIVAVAAEARARATMVESALERRDAILTGIQQRLAGLEAQTESEDSAVLAALRVAALKQSAAAGEAISPALEALRFELDRADAVAADLAVLDSLSDRAIPTAYSLQRQFAAVAEATLTSVGQTPQSDWMGRMIETLETTVVVRRRDGAASIDSLDGQIAVAEAAVDQGLLQEAVDIMSALPAYTQGAWQTWVVAAEDRIALDQSVAALDRHVTRMLAGDDS